MEGTCRDCRRFGAKLFFKGERCLTPKCAFTRRNNPPGSTPIKGKSSRSPRRKKKSEFGQQLEEKQKAKAEYGIRERQFRAIFKKAAKTRAATGEVLLQNLERRLDNVIYRLGWAGSRNQARQIVGHKHIRVNDKIVDIPSALVKPKDIIEPRDKEIIKKTAVEKSIPPKWLKVEKNFTATVTNVPLREEIDTPIDEQLIVEYYSR